MMIGKLMQDLEDHNDLSDTVIIFMNDHYPYTLNQDDYESIKGVTDVHDKQKGTFFIWSQDIQSSNVDRLTSSFDVLPTIAALFGLDMNYKEYVGLDMFDTSIDPHVYFKDYYVYDNHTYIDMFNTLDDYQLTVYRKSIIYYEYSIAVLKTNYFKYK
jgi:arylsulfatase A-like enzyme